MFGLGIYSIATIPVWSQFTELLAAILSLLIGLTGSPGLAIILLTLSIRALLIPLAIYTQRTNQRLRELQPRLAKLRQRYRQNPQRLSAETARLYRESRISPYAGILPALIQLPLLLGLYQAINTLAAASLQGFLWLPSLTQADPWHILPIVAALFQLIQARMAMPLASELPPDAQQRLLLQLTQLLPLTAIAFGWFAAAALALYWATQAAFGAAQQYVLSGWGGLCDWLPFLPVNHEEHRR